MTLYRLSGTNLGQYELRELIGAGRMGAIYRAYQPNLRREVAIRVLPPSSYSERFAYLAGIATSLEHPHIVRVYDYGTEQDTNYLVMQFMIGGSLTERLVQQALPSLGEITSLLQQISSALSYAHERDVIHRNVNPSNVMFHDNGLACLTDFGFTQLINHHAGSWGYLSPEQWNNERLTPATDQYSLAVIIYYLITGRAPFAGATPSAIMFKHLYEMPPPLPNVSYAVTAVLEQALAKRAEDRFPTVADFAEAFTNAVGNETGVPTGFFSAPFERKPVPEIVTPTLSPTPAYPRIPPVATTTPLHKSPLFWVISATVLTVLLIGAVLRGEADNRAESAAMSVSGAIEETPTDLLPSGGITSNNSSSNPVVLATETQPTLPPSATPVSTDTPTAVPTASNTPLPPSATAIPPSATSMPPSNTPTALPSATPRPPSSTPIPPSNTPTALPSATVMLPSATSTGTPTTMPTASNTPSPTNTATILPTNTTVPTATATTVPTSTLTLTPSYTPTFLPTLEPCNLADVNGDNLVDILDIRAISAHYGTTSSDPTFEELYDLDQDGVIGILDVQTAVAQFGAVCEP